MKKPRKRAKFVLGVTGGFGCGKTTVARLFAQGSSADVIDADAIAHALLEPRTAVYRRVCRAFGPGIIGPDGTISRQALSLAVFSDPAKLSRLNRIMHPAILAAMRRQVRTGDAPFAVLDAPLLFETGLDRLADAVVVVKATRSVQKKRLSRRDGFSARQIMQRVRAQLPISEKIRKADFIIDNTGSRSHTRKQVQCIRRKLWRS